MCDSVLFGAASECRCGIGRKDGGLCNTEQYRHKTASRMSSVLLIAVFLGLQRAQLHLRFGLAQSSHAISIH